MIKNISVCLHVDGVHGHTKGFGCVEVFLVMCSCSRTLSFFIDTYAKSTSSNYRAISSQSLQSDDGDRLHSSETPPI